jgi:transposase-like protein
VQTCIAHQIRNSIALSWKARKLIMPDLKAIYLRKRPGQRRPHSMHSRPSGARHYPAIGQAFGAPRSMCAAVCLRAGNPQDDLHKDTMESLNRSLHKIIKMRRSRTTTRR